MNTSVSSHNFTGCITTFLSSFKIVLYPPPKKTLNPFNSNYPSFLFLLNPCKQQLTFCLHGFTNFRISHINEIMQYIYIYILWDLSIYLSIYIFLGLASFPSIVLSRFIHIVAWITTFFLFLVEEYSVVWTTTTCPLNHWWKFGSPLQTSLYMYYVQELVFSSDGYIPRNGIVTCCLVSKVMSDSLWTMDSSPPASSVHEISQARTLERVAVSFSRGSSWPKDRSWGSSIAGRFFTTEPPGKQNCYLLSL